MVILWYGLVPVAGALVKRYIWHTFRKRFDELRLSPILDYSAYSRQDGETAPFRFIGGFESVTDDQILWIRGEDLAVPVSLKNAETYLLPMQKSEGIPEVFDPGDESPERIRWERVSALTEGARVFVGGLLAYQDGRWSFVSTKEHPLMVIFYDGFDRSLTTRAIRAGRRPGEYWNAITPYALIIGALCQLIIAGLFIFRPAFHLTVIVSMIALFVPLYPLIPPGLLFTVVYRRLAWRSRILRAYRDIARLPLRYLAPPGSTASRGQFRQECALPNGERYGYIRCHTLPSAAQDGAIPLLLPELKKIKKVDTWYIFGALDSDEPLPTRPRDPLATFGILPDNPEILAGRCATAAYALELVAWLILLAGIGINIFFLGVVLALL